MPNQLDVMPNQLDVMPNQLDVMPNQLDVMPNQLDVMPNQLDVMPNQLDVMRHQLDVIPNQLAVMRNQLQRSAPLPTALPRERSFPRPHPPVPGRPLPPSAGRPAPRASRLISNCRDRSGQRAVSACPRAAQRASRQNPQAHPTDATSPGTTTTPCSIAAITSFRTLPVYSSPVTPSPDATTVTPQFPHAVTPTPIDTHFLPLSPYPRNGSVHATASIHSPPKRPFRCAASARCGIATATFPVSAAALHKPCHHPDREQ